MKFFFAATQANKNYSEWEKNQQITVHVYAKQQLLTVLFAMQHVTMYHSIAMEKIFYPSWDC